MGNGKRGRKKKWEGDEGEGMEQSFEKFLELPCNNHNC